MRKRMPGVARPATVTAVAFAAVLFTACGRSSSAGPATPPDLTASAPSPDIIVPAGQAIAIGASVPLTGDQRVIGESIADAADLAAGDYGGSIRGHPLRIVPKDDGCNDPEAAADVASSLTREAGLVGVIGPACTTAAQAADDIYEQAGVVHVSPTVTRPEVSDEGERYFFRTAWRDDVQAGTQATYARTSLNATNAAVIDDGEPYGKGLADAFVGSFEALGGRVLTHERVRDEDPDLTAMATRLAAIGPDAVVFEGLNPAAAQLVKELRKAGYAGAFVAPDGAFSVRDFLEPAGDAANAATITAGPVPDDAFVSRFRERTHRAPATAFVLQAHDGVTALLRALDAVATVQSDGSLVIDRSALVDALRSRTFSGLTGTVHFDARGDRAGTVPVEAGIVVYRVTDGKFEAVR